MTREELKELKKLSALTTKMHIKLFGNGTEIGCIDHRLGQIEVAVKDFVTKKDCEATHGAIDQTEKNRKALYFFGGTSFLTFIGLVLLTIQIFSGG